MGMSCRRRTFPPHFVIIRNASRAGFPASFPFPDTEMKPFFTNLCRFGYKMKGNKSDLTL